MKKLEKQIEKKTDDNSKSLLLLVLFSILALAVLAYLRISILLPGQDFDNDCYYHIKAADIFTYIATTKDFPWTEMSIWKTTFYDKELGFHGLLFLLRKFSEFAGISMAPPFNFSSIFLIALLVAAFSFGAYKYCRKTALIVSPFLPLFMSPLFLKRITLVRPHLIAIVFFLIVTFVMMSSLKMKYKYLWTFILSFICAYFHSSPQLLLIPLIIYSFSCIIHDRNLKSLFPILLLVCAIFGIALAFTLHPQFPNTFILWYIQGVDVIKTMLHISKASISLGSELLPPPSDYVMHNFLIFVFLIINFILFILNSEKKVNQIFLLLLNAVLAFGFLFSIRFIEYAVPVSVFSLTYFVSIFNPKITAWRFIPKIFSYKGQAIIVLAVLLFMVPFDSRFLSSETQWAPHYGFVKYAEENIKKGSYIALMNWGDFPRIFYLTQDYKMSGAMDPMFSYYAYPERTQKIELFMYGAEQPALSELKSAYGTNILWASKYDHRRIMQLLDIGATLVYYDKEGCLLDLDGKPTQAYHQF